jgi:hypothetical protein
VFEKRKSTEERMTKALFLAGVATLVLAVSPALADPVTAWDGTKKITIGGKTYDVSGSRTKVTVGGTAGTRDSIKVGLDCKVTGAEGGEATALDCK